MATAVAAISKVLREESDGWHVYSEAGKHLGGPYSKSDAEERLRQIEHFKARQKSVIAKALQGENLRRLNAEWSERILKSIDMVVLKYNRCHDANGKFCSTGGGAGGLKIKATRNRAWHGEQVETKTKLSKLESGALGEQIAIAYLKSKGMKDARTLNVQRNNFPVDLIQDHSVVEVKTGLVSNGKSAQQWRATIGQPGKKEAAWLKTASKEQKAAWNLKKQQAILARKQKAVDEVSKQLGKRVKASTMGIIINPDTKRADIYVFKGFHLRVAWNSPQAKKAYVGSVQYE